MNFRNKKILVTGGAGFIGGHTANALIRLGAKVSIIDNLLMAKRNNINPQAVFYDLNVADPKLKEVFEKEKPEIIYHFSFNSLVPKSSENPMTDLDCIAGSLNILKNMQNLKNSKIVFASSGFIYGNTKNLPAKETEPIDPISPYVIAKNTVENYIKFFNKAHGINYIILRYATVYGPGQVTGAMSDYIRKLSAGQQVEIWGDGEKTRDYVFIDDVVKANIAILNLPASFEDPVFNVSTGAETTLNDLFFKIAKFLGKEAKPVYLPDRPGEQVRYCLDYSKIKNAIGWEPQYNLEKGLKSRLISEKLISK